MHFLYYFAAIKLYSYFFTILAKDGLRTIDAASNVRVRVGVVCSREMYKAVIEI